MMRTLFSGWVLGSMAILGIAGNALFFQDGRHPEPFFHTRVADDPAGPSPDLALVMEIQRELARRDLYSGSIDGIAGPETRLAIRSFERARGLADTGEPSDALLARLATSRPDLVIAKTSPRVEAPPEPDPELARIQAALSRAAYGPIVADGLPGPQTREAIMRFQLDEGLPVTGTLDETVVERLKAVGALGA